MRKSYKIALIIVTVSLLAISVAYAALSTTLNVTVNKVTQSGIGPWDVAFVTGTVNATVEGTSSAGRSCGAATVSATSVTVADTLLSKPDDGCVYHLQVRNGSGGINAVLGAITPTNPTSITCNPKSGANMVCGNITYKLTTDSAGATLLTANSFTLPYNTTKDVYLVARYTGSTVSDTQIVQSGAKFSLQFNQA